MAKCALREKISFLAVVGFCYQCFENPFGYLLIRFFGGPQDISNPIGKAWIVRKLLRSEILPNLHRIMLYFAICGSVRGFIVSEVFWGA